MTCFRPLEAWQREDGEIVFVERGRIRRPLSLPCGQCIGCRLERSRQWAVRCVHESQLHDFSSFVTLTYDDSCVPDDMSLNYRHFQLFMKRLRKQLGPVRFYMCGEYGEKLLRPHYHACVFGAFFEDRVPISGSRDGFTLYRSSLLDSLWPHGMSSVGDVTFESAAYVARYVMKKITGDRANAHYQRVLESTGEVVQVVPEFTKMSLRPAVGARWIEKFYPEVVARGTVLSRGHEASVPRYYKKYLAEHCGDDYGAMEKAWYDALTPEALAHTTPERLAVRSRVAEAAVKAFGRSLE